MAEKRSPEHDLAAFKAAMADRSTRLMTGSALRDAATLGFGTQEILSAVKTMEASQFYKSMTSNQNPAYWQDVYHVPVDGVVMYVKLTADPDLKLLSFKVK